MECIFTRNSQAPSRSGSLFLRASLDFDLERGIRGVPTGVTPGVLNPLTPSFSSTGRGLSCSMLWVRRLRGGVRVCLVWICIHVHVQLCMWALQHVTCDIYVYVSTCVSVRDNKHSLSLSLSLRVPFLPSYTTVALFIEIWDLKQPPYNTTTCTRTISCTYI
jgi:hypothetical protein